MCAQGGVGAACRGAFSIKILHCIYEQKEMNMNKLNTFLGLVFSLTLASPAQAVSSVIWDTSPPADKRELTGTLNGVRVILRPTSDTVRVVDNANFTGSNFNPPLETTMGVRFTTDFTLTFDQPIFNLRIYFNNLVAVAGDGIKVFYEIDQPDKFDFLLGFDVTNTSINNGVDLNFVNGINVIDGAIVFTESVSSLTVEGRSRGNPDPRGSGTFTLAVPFSFNDGVVTMVGIACFGGLKGLEHLRKGRNRNKGNLFFWR